MNINIERYRIFIKVILSAFLLGSGMFWLLDSSQAEETVKAVSRPALTVRTTMLREDKWAHTLEANGSIYLGPYTDVGAIRQTLRVLKTLFPIRDCPASTASTSLSGSLRRVPGSSADGPRVTAGSAGRHRRDRACH